MGDRFYMQQQKAKPRKRRLKKDIIADINSFLGRDVPSLDKVTVDGLEQLFDAIQRKVYET